MTNPSHCEQEFDDTLWFFLETPGVDADIPRMAKPTRG